MDFFKLFLLSRTTIDEEQIALLDSVIASSEAKKETNWLNIYQALKLMVGRDFRGALNLLSKAVGDGHDGKTALYLESSCFFHLQEYDEAIKIIDKEFKDLIGDKDDSLNILVVRSWIIKAIIMSRNDDRSNSEETFERIIETFGPINNDYFKQEVAYAMVELGYHFYYGDEEAEAISTFDSVINKYNKCKNKNIKGYVLDAKIGKAVCLSSVNLNGEAFKIYNLIIRSYINSKSLLLKLKSYQALLNSGTLHRDLGDVKSALQTCDLLIRETKDCDSSLCKNYFMRALMLKGLVFINVKSYYDAVECYDLALNIPGAVDHINLILAGKLYLNKAHALVRISNNKAAVETLDEFMNKFRQYNQPKINSLILQAYVRKADYCRRLDPSKSQDVLDEGIQFSMNSLLDKYSSRNLKKLFITKAKFLEKDGEIEDAYLVYKQLLTMFPKDVDLKLTLARLSSKTDLRSSTTQIKEIVEKVSKKIGDKKKYFETHMKATNDRFNDFLLDQSKLSNDAFLLTLRRWNSFTPIIPVDGETSRGGGYFIRAWDKVEKRWKGVVVDPGYNFIENFCNAGGRVHDIDAVVITHAHNDHTIDFESLCTLFHKYNKQNGSTKQVKIYLNVGTFMKFSGLLDLRNAKYIKDIIVLNVFDKHSIFSGLDLYVQPAYHDEIITKSHSVGLLFKFNWSTKGDDKVLDSDKNDRYILFTGDTGLYPSKSIDGELEADVSEGNEIHKLYRPDLVTANGEITLDLLVAHIGSIYKDELDPEASYNKRFYPNHLGIMGVVSLVNDLRPRLTFVSEFGEELMAIRLKLVEGIATIFEEHTDDLEETINELQQEKSKTPAILPCDLSLTYKIFERSIYCVDTLKDEPCNRVECFAEDKNLYYKTKSSEDFDRAAAVKQYKYGLSSSTQGGNNLTPRPPSHLKKSQ